MKEDQVMDLAISMVKSSSKIVVYSVPHILNSRLSLVDWTQNLGLTTM